MKTLHIMMAVFMTWVGAMPAWAGSSLLKSAEWPFSVPTLFLKGGVNAVTAGSDLLFWAMGDTIAVIDKSSFSIVATFQVATSTAIQDMLFDDTTDTLYVAAGYDEKEQSGGLQIFDLTVPGSPALTVVYDESPDNPGSYKVNDSESGAVSDIDARGLGLYGGVLYLADDNFGLRVIDVADPAHLEEVLLTTPDLGSDDSTLDDRISGYKQPDVDGNFKATGGYINLSLYPYDGKVYAFVLDFYHGLKVFDVTDPAVIEDPVEKDTRTNFYYGSISLLSDFFVTETDGRLTTFVTGGNATGSTYVLSRLDVEDLPITNFGRCATPGEARSVCASGNYAYVADGESGLTVVDIAAVPEPGTVLTYTKAGSYTTEVNFSYNVFLEGATLYLATGESGLNRLNVTNPASPVLIDRLVSPISGDDVCVAGDYTYMLDRTKGLRIFDSSEPSYPLLRSYLAFEGPSVDLAVSGNYAYIAKSGGAVAIVDVTNRLAPVLTASTIGSNDPRKMFISGDILYIADGVDGLRLVNITDPLHPVVLGSAATAGSALSVYVHADRAYVAEGAAGLGIFNVSNPAAPVLLAAAAMADARDVSVLSSGSSVYALVADGAAGLKILDVSDVENPLPDPAVVNTMDTDTETPSTFTAVSVATLGDLAFVGMGPDGILVLDLKTPLSPKEIDHELSASYISDIIAQTIEETPYVTVAERYIGFRILYLYSSSATDDTADLVPSIDSGCFIDTASDKWSVTGWGKGWIESILKTFSRFISI